MRRLLKATQGSQAGKTFTLGSRTVIGRSGDTDIQLMEKGVSRQHACLVEDDNGNMLLMDLSSRNGTWVGGERITKRFLEPSDTFRLGESAFIYEEVEQGAVDPFGDEDDLKLLSGPALEATAVARIFEPTPTSLTGCMDPLHEVARIKAWKHCPACGGKF